MSIYKRCDVWWYKFVFNGERIRVSTKQSNKRTALFEFRSASRPIPPINTKDDDDGSGTLACAKRMYARLELL
jgi:hypothetical protein